MPELQISLMSEEALFGVQGSQWALLSIFILFSQM